MRLSAYLEKQGKWFWGAVGLAFVVFLGLADYFTGFELNISFFMEGIFSLVSGGLADRFGPRIVLSLSSILVAAGYCLMPLVHSPWQLHFFYDCSNVIMVVYQFP